MDKKIKAHRARLAKSVQDRIKWGYVDHVKSNKEQVEARAELSTLRRELLVDDQNALMTQSKQRRRSAEKQA